MKSAKITKYFEIENNNPLYYNTKTETETPRKNIPTTTNTHSTFNTLYVHLVTLYQPSISTIFFALYFPNHRHLNSFSKIQNVTNPIVGEFHALYQSLKYIVYHPSLFIMLNKYKFIITTNSSNIISIYNPSDSLLESNLYFKIQSLQNCIKHLSIEYSKNIENANNYLKEQLLNN